MNKDRPWIEEEPSYLWADDATKLPCVILRDALWGTLKGYVGVPAGHPAVGLDPIALTGVQVHTGVTCAGPRLPQHDALPPDYTTRGAWWFGFECSQPGDLRPNESIPDGTYRDAVYVRGQCAALAEHLQELQAKETAHGSHHPSL